MKCPNCGSPDIDRDEVDIGVGVQYGPWRCRECGSYEGMEANLDAAIKHLNEALVPKPAGIRLVAKYDQLRAECRDDPVKREAAVLVMIEQGSTREDAEHWLDHGRLP